MWLFSIIFGILISWVNLFLLLKSRRNVFIMIARYILISFIILCLLYLRLDPIFLILGFTIFPFLLAMRAIIRRQR